MKKSKKKQVFVIWESFPPLIGGSAARGYRMYKALSEKGLNVTVFTARAEHTKMFERVSANFQIVRVPPSVHYFKRSSRLVFILNTLTNTLRYYCLGILLFVYGLRRKPEIVIQECGTYLFDSYLIRMLGLDSHHFAPWVWLKKILHIPLLTYFVGLWNVHKRYFPNWMKAVDQVIIVDEWMTQALKDMGVNQEIVYLPVSINTEDFHPDTALPGNKVLFVGRLAKDRACDTLIRAIPAIAEEVKDCTFTIVGNGAEKEVLEELAKQLGVYDNITFTGGVDPRNIKDVYAGHKVFINPMRAPGIGNVTIEALASGIPVVKSTINGLVENLIVEGENGYLFQVDDHNDLANKIIKILKDEHWEELSKSARKSALRFDINTIVNDLEDIIQNA